MAGTKIKRSLFQAVVSSISGLLGDALRKYNHTDPEVVSLTSHMQMFRKMVVDKEAAASATKAASVTTPPMAPGSSKKMIVPKGDDPLVETPRTATVPPIAKPPVVETPAPKPVTRPPVRPAESAESKSAAGKIELNIVKAEETKKAKIALPQSDDKNYEFPPLKLLREQVRGDISNSEEEHRQNAENLLRILSEFGVEVTLGEIHVGPVITCYEVIPAAGVRVEKISGLDKNIALGMRAQSVRILAPIPGKAAVGVEVPTISVEPPRTPLAMPW